MATMKITILGLETSKQGQNKSIFEKLQLPSGYDSEEVQNVILLECGEFETLYADADFLTEAIGIWSRKWFRTFDKWLTALNLEYNPLDNYDRTEEWTDDTDTVGTSKINTNGSSGSQTDSNVSAYDSGTYSPDSQDITSGTTSSVSDGSNKDEIRNVRKGRAHGNIGVTTSMQLIESELKLAEWNLYQHIADIFKKELCIAVYE